MISEAKACVFCGWSSVTFAEPEPPKSFRPSAPKLQDLKEPEQIAYSVPDACPICSCADIRKASNIVAEGSWTKSSTGSQVNVGYIDHVGPTVSGGPSFSTGRGATQLAQWLGPPQDATPFDKDGKKMAENAGIVAAFVTFFVASVILGGLVSSVRGPSSTIGDDGLWTIPVAMVISVLVGVACARYKRKETDHLADEHNRLNRLGARAYRRAMLAWERCYYCPKCNTAWDAGTGRSCQAQLASGSLWL
jgi:hypothetical protein